MFSPDLNHCTNRKLLQHFKMFRLIVVSAVLAMAAAAPAPGLIGSPLLSPALPATLLPRVAIAPAETTIVRQAVVVQEPTPVLRTVPVPLRAVSYAAPAVIPAPIAAPLSLASPLSISPYASPYAPLGAPLASTLLLK